MKSNKTKKRVGLVACLCAVAIVAGGTMALFSTSDSASKEGSIGSVNVSMSNLNIDNVGNINPGDGDPELPTDPEDPRTPGTPHDITFKVSNNGTKSIKTRNVITIEMNDKTDGLDPSVFKVTNNKTEVSEKYYVVDGKDISAASFDASTSTCSAVKYIITGDIFDGNGTSLEKGGNAEKEDNSTVKANDSTVPEKTYTYALSMSHSASDKYQGKKVSITVEVQGMQYRNTNNSDWKTLFTDGVIVG